MKYRKLSTGNYLSREGKKYIFIYRRPHGGWCARITENERLIIIGKWFSMNGYFATALPTIYKAKQWANDALNKIKRFK